MAENRVTVLEERLGEMLLQVNEDGLCIFCGLGIVDDSADHAADCELVAVIEEVRASRGRA